MPTIALILLIFSIKIIISFALKPVTPESYYFALFKNLCPFKSVVVVDEPSASQSLCESCSGLGVLKNSLLKELAAASLARVWGCEGVGMCTYMKNLIF